MKIILTKINSYSEKFMWYVFQRERMLQLLFFKISYLGFLNSPPSLIERLSEKEIGIKREEKEGS